SRYVLFAPFGLLVDGFLALTYISVFFKYFNEKFDWSRLNNPVVKVALIWFGYSLFEFVNPVVASRLAWIYHVRGISLYMLMTDIREFILMDKYKYFMVFIYIWMFFGVLGALKGAMQLYIGLDPYEMRWLDVVGHTTHIIFGKLRVFSFFSDAGQFGASQGHTAMVALIIAFTTKSFRERAIFIIVAIFCFYGMLISGTRGIWGVLAGTGVFWLLLNRNFKLFFIGVAMAAAVFFFFRYTFLGQDIFFIRRMRGAFDPNNPSLIIRLENQAKLRPYLAIWPFGGGIGNAGAKAQRFSPNTFLANTATDSWFVEIWAEQGVVGLTLYLGLLSFILIKGSYIIMHRIRDPGLQGKMIAIISGIFGTMVSSYGNGVFGQMPTGLLMYSSMAFIFLSPLYDKEIAEKRATGIPLTH
ncbi:MAG: O-antigen ligase family protein, partial [Bacteroidota bacterium]